MDSGMRYGYLLVVLLPGGALIALAVYLRRRWIARDAALVDALIVPPTPKFTGADESLTAKAARRRAHVDARTREAAAIASGHVEDRFQIVRRK